MLSASKLNFMRQRLYIPVSQFAGIQQKALDGNAANIDTVLTSANSGNAPLTEIGSLGMMSLKVANTNSINHVMAIPTDWDRRQDIKMRCLFAATAANGSSTPVLTYTQLISGTTVLIAPATAIDTAIGAYTDVTTLTASQLMTTGWGIINAGTILDTADFLAFLLTFGVTAISYAYFLGIEFEYAPKFWQGLRGGTRGSDAYQPD